MNKKEYTHLGETLYSEVLDNGLKVNLIPRRGVSKVYGFFVTKFGSNDTSFIPLGETNKTTVPEGVAHFLEHKLFEKEDYDVMEKFGAFGAMPNAYTNFTETAYHFSATDYAIENVETLLDFVQEPYFTEETVENEKGIIVQEAQMYYDDPDRRLYAGCLQALFHNHPVRNEVIGTIDSINATTKEDLYTCYNTFYHPSNMSLTITGNFDPEQMMARIKENQTAKKYGTAEKITRFMPEEPATVAENEKTIQMPVSVAKCVVGFKEYHGTLDEDSLQKQMIIPSMMLDHFFGRSGSFYKELYEERLIDHSFRVESTAEYDYGYSLVYSNTGNPDLFGKRVKEMLHSIKEKPLNKEDFERLKKRRIGRMIRGLNSVEFMAEEYAWHEQRGVDYFELVRVVQSLKLEEVNEFIQDWIKEDRLTICKVVPE